MKKTILIALMFVCVPAFAAAEKDSKQTIKTSNDMIFESRALSENYALAYISENPQEMIFSLAGNKTGTVDFSGESVKFEGDIDKSARVFFETVFKKFIEPQREECPCHKYNVQVLEPGK